jgi:G protein-coupled receptor 157
MIMHDPSAYCTNGTLLGVSTSVRALVGVTCILSMAGALLIIFSYILIKEIRTTTRKILLHLSIMDFMAAAGNSIGVFINFDQYFVDSTNNVSSQVRGACEAQAFFSMYGTISSILWTNCMAVYIYLHVMQLPKVVWSMYVFYVLNYGLPLITSLWFLVTKKFGYSPYGGSGWCSVIIYDNETGWTLPIVIFFANDIWVYLTVIIVPLIYLSLKVHVYNIIILLDHKCNKI